MQSLEITSVLEKSEWDQLVKILELSPGQAEFLWHALRDPRDRVIAERMGVSRHGAHAHRMRLFRKLDVESMPGAVARVFAAYVHWKWKTPPAGCWPARGLEQVVPESGCTLAEVGEH